MKHPGELSLPLTIRGDDEAVEMLRIWISEGTIKVSPNIGLWADADTDVDERDAWGRLLADTIKHISRGLALGHNMDRIETATRIRDELLFNLSSHEGAIDGKFVED